MPSIIQSLAQDLNRSLLHGARQRTAGGRTQPATILSGQQAAAEVDVLSRGVELLMEGSDQPAATLLPDAANVTKTNASVSEALTHPEQYFKLTEEKQIPTWIYHQKTFSLPDKPLPDDIVTWTPNSGGLKSVLRLTAPILREADLQPPAIATLCRVASKKVDNATYQVAEPWPYAKWSSAILLRCSLTPAWTRGEELTAENPHPAPPPKSDPPVPVFELGGIPQSERWYLDQLGLLDDLTATLEDGTSVQLWLEKPKAADQSTPPPEPIKEWVAIRRNLTGLARPGEGIADINPAENDTLPPEYPYASTEKDLPATLRLLQMSSIANSGGYFLRVHEPALNVDTLSREKHFLIVTITLPSKAAEGRAEAQKLSSAANAVAYQYENPDQVPKLVRFEGDGHVIVEPYAPPGCVSFGWRRPLPAVTEDTNLPEFPGGFARTVHLLDYEIKDRTGAFFEQWSEELTWDAAGNRLTAWRKETCAGDTGPALSPVKHLPGQTDLGDPIAILPMDRDNMDADSPDGTIRTEYCYRTTIRYAKDGDIYARLRSPDQKNFTITAGYRDTYGNRLLRLQGAQSRELYYTDSLTAPGEWPGFLFHLFPSASGEVSLEVSYERPSTQSTRDVDRQLRLILAQLRGLGNDIEVKLVNELADDGSEHFHYAPQGRADGLHKALVDLLEKAARGDRSGNAVLKFNITVQDAVAPRAILPTLVIRRTDPTVQPPATAWPKVEALRDAVQAQLTTARSALALAAGTFASPAGAVSEFKKIAEAFQQSIGVNLQCQTAIRRNRFNEHELWFIPDTLFPRAQAQVPPLFWSPRPLSTILGADRFESPDFADYNTQGAGRRWKGFLLKEQTVSGRDYDALGRSAFDCLENILRAGWITARTFSAENKLLWGDILRGKDNVAKTLGSASSNYVVPIFAKDPPPSMKGGVERLCQDAFQRDLRLFYGLDALAQWPVKLPDQVKGITNFYGKVEATITPRPDSALPRYSDFVLNVQDDRGTGNEASRITVTYDLPPGQERYWRDWVTETLTARITHLQFPIPGQVERSLFNQGQWVEILDDLAQQPVNKLSYKPKLAVPAADRRFPKEPSLTEAAQLKHTTPENGAMTPESLAEWGWQIDFETEDNPNDTIYLQVDYNEPEEDISKVDDAMEDDPENWSTTNLLQDLVVLSSLAPYPLDWWTTDPGQAALRALPTLLEFLHLHLVLPSSDALDAPVDGPDEFRIQLKGGATLPEVTALTKRRVTEVEPSKKPSETTNLVVFTIRAEASKQLRLFGELRAHNFRPQLRLKRNDDLDPKERTNSFLVYSCGPVLYPAPVRIANRWSRIVPPIAGGVSLEAALKQTLAGVFGPGADLGKLTLRFDVKHAWNAGELAMVTPYLLYPSDLAYSNVDALAGMIARKYVAWLQEPGGSAAALLAEMESPKFCLGVQIASAENSAGHLSRTLLEVESLEFDMTKLTPI